MRVYDVCNDLSITASGLKEKPEGYNWKRSKGICTDEKHKGQEVVIDYGYCKKSDECHYVVLLDSPVQLDHVKSVNGIQYKVE